MARFITVHVQCDWQDCDTRAEEGDGTIVEKTVAVDRSAPKAFLLCEKHLEALNDILMPLMAAGVKVEQPSAKPPRTKAPSATPSGEETVALLTCLECGRNDIKNKAGMAQHVIRSDGFASLAEYEAKHHVHID